MNRLIPVIEQVTSEDADTSKLLDAYARNDFSYIHETLFKKYYSESWDARQARDVPFVSAFANEVCVHYSTAPVRTFEGPGAGEVEAFYGTIDANGALAATAKKAVVQGTSLLMLLPVLTPTGWGWSWECLAPWEWEETPHPSAPRELDRLVAIRIRLPRASYYDQIQYDIAELAQAPVRGTETHLERAMLCSRAKQLAEMGLSAAVWASDGAPVYPTATGEPGQLPLGRYPLAVCRLGDPIKGRFSAPVNKWLANAQEAVSLHLSGMEFGCRYSGGQLVIQEGQLPKREPGAKDKIPMGPDKILPVPNGRLENVDRPFDAASWETTQTVFTGSLRLSAGMRPESFTGAALTGDAKAIELWQQRTVRADVSQAFVALEQSFLRAACVALGWRYGAGSAPLDARGPSVTYVVPQPPRAVEQEASAARIWASMGLLDIVALYQDRQRLSGRSITREQAASEVAANHALAVSILGENAAAGIRNG